MKINMLRYILVLVPEVPGGGPNKSLAGLWPIIIILFSSNSKLSFLYNNVLTVKGDICALEHLEV